MIEIHEQKEFDLESEKNDIILVNNLENTLVKTIDKKMNGFLQKLMNEPFTTIFTLDKLPAKRLHIVNKKDLENPDKRLEIYKKIANLKNDLCVLIDTFEVDDYLEIVQDLSEVILTENSYTS